MASDYEADMQLYQPMVVHELRLYLVNLPCKNCSKPLVSWAKARKEFPKLYVVALYVMSMASTSIRSESYWSHADRIESVHRTMLHIPNLDQLLFLCQNSKNTDIVESVWVVVSKA